METATVRRPLLVAGLVLGMGLGGFFDGIVLHQILGWHHLICEQRTCHPISVADLQRKNTADGYFHLGVYLLTILGCGLLFRAGHQTPNASWSGRLLLGAALAGWGVFNLVEGIIDHHLLQIHHVRPRSANPLAWDVGFLAFGALLVFAGWRLTRAGAQK
jgi:uncharacterized membrane protein